MRISDWSSDVCSSDLLSHAQRAPAPGFAQPGQVETGELPHRVHAQAAGHHRIALEVAIEEPQVRTYVHLGADLALAERAAIFERRARKSVVWGKSVSARVDLGGHRTIKKKKKT